MSEQDPDFFSLIDEINAGGSPEPVAVAYQTRLRDRYWKAHDLPGVIALGRAGILYCLAHSLRSAAKAMAYDVGSFTWPGWEEPGIHPTPDDLTFGRRCAELNLKLAIELAKPAEKVASAHWLVGAHALTAAEWTTACAAFDAAIPLLKAESPFAVYLHGCALIAKARAQNDPTSFRRKLAEITPTLQGAGDSESATYVKQIKSIVKLYGSA